MQKIIKISVATFAALILAILVVNLVMGATTAVNTPSPTVNNLEAIESLTPNDNIIISLEQAENKEQLKELAPATPEDAESSIYPVRRRFILYTNDGLHIMWGIYGNGRFVGTDNLGKRCWGIYGKGVFAGFYDSEFFWGKYCNGSWKAEYLFGLNHCCGSYVLFPPPTITSDTAISP